MGKKKKSLNTMGTAANPFKCGAGSGCPDKGGECRLWHPTDDQQHLPQSRDMSSVDIVQEEACLSDLPEEQQPATHRNFGEKEFECEPTIVALHSLAASIKQGADRESREAFKILIQEYQPQGYRK